MKKIYILLMISLFALSFSLQAEEPVFRVKVKLNNLPSTEKISLGMYYNGRKYIVDSGQYQPKTSEFIFEHKTAREPGIYLLVFPDKSFTEFIVDKEQQFDIEADYPDLAKTIVFRGSEDNQRYADYLRSQQALVDERKASIVKLMKSGNTPKNSEKRSQILKTYEEKADLLKQDFMRNNPENLMTSLFQAEKKLKITAPPAELSTEEKKNWVYQYRKTHYFDHTDLCDERLIRTLVYPQKFIYYIDTLLVQHPDTLQQELFQLIEKTKCNKEVFKYLVFLAMDRYQHSKEIGYDKLWLFLAENYYLTDEVDGVRPILKERMARRVAKTKSLLNGNIPPEFSSMSMPDKAKKQEMTSVFAIQDKYSVILFWDPECTYCKGEAGRLKNLYKVKDSLNFDVVAVCRDCENDKWLAAIEKYKYEWLNLNGKESSENYIDTWDVQQTPTIYLLDPEKKIVAKKIKVEQIAALIEADKQAKKQK